MAIDVAALGGGVTLERRMYITNIGGEPIDEITTEMLRCDVKWSVGREGGTAMTVEFQLIERSRKIQPQNTFVSPEIELHWGDGTVRRTRLGVFIVGLPQKSISPGGVVTTYKGRDLTWVLANSYLTKNDNFPAGTNLGEAIARIYRAAGLTNIDVRKTTRTLGSGRTFRRGIHRRSESGSLAGPAGWYQSFMDLNGAMRTLPYRSWSDVAPVGVITPKVLIGEIQMRPEVDEVPNTVMATMQRSDQTIYRYAFNRDPSSPISIQNINPPGRRITYEISDSNVETIADLENLAKQTLLDLSTFKITYDVKLKPDPSWLGIHRTIDIAEDVAINGEPEPGRYRINAWSIGMNPDTAVCGLTIGKTISLVDIGG